MLLELLIVCLYQYANYKELIYDKYAVFELIQKQFHKILADKVYIKNNLRVALAKEKEILLLFLKKKIIKLN